MDLYYLVTWKLIFSRKHTTFLFPINKEVQRTYLNPHNPLLLLDLAQIQMLNNAYADANLLFEYQLLLVHSTIKTIEEEREH